MLILFFSKIENSLLWLIFHVTVLAFLLWDRSAYLNRIKKWSVIVLIPLNFTELHYLVHTVHPIDYDNLLIQIDRFMFGTDPTIWMEQFTNPYVTEFLQIIYSTFYFLPIGLGIILAKKKQENDLNFLIFQIVYGFYLSYIGYFILPAIGPRFTLDHLQSFPLTGVWLANDIQILLNTLENSQRDAFPSGHTAMTLLTLYYAQKYHRPYFNFMIPVTSLMLISTVYLRYHYVIDVFAGIGLFYFTVVSGKYLYKYLQKE
ncbi:MAG: phosphatase PAP2 family protein [Calditrichaeota bacterium]|nr:phosphatase PAP2 family protein [Calditrichota bacterium]